MGVHVSTMRRWFGQPRTIRCARCGVWFVLLARFDAAVSNVGILIPFESDRHMQSRLSEASQAAVAAAHQGPVGRARCPSCREWQPWMIEQARPMAFLTGFLTGLVIGIVPMSFAIAWIPERSPRHGPVAISSLVACAVCLATLAVLHPLALERGKKCDDPRAMDPSSYDALAVEAADCGLPAGELWARRLRWHIDVALPNAADPGSGMP